MILVVGGSGRLGRLVVDELTARGVEVRVLARHATSSVPSLAGRADLVDGDVRDQAAITAAARGVSCIVVASHGVESRERDGIASVDEAGRRAVAAAARAVGSSIAMVSMVGAGPDAALPLARTKWAAERVVRESGAPWTIVRSAAFAQTWAMILTLSAGRTGRPGIIGPGLAVHPFVDVGDVAGVVARVATDDSLRGRIIQVRGPDELTLSQLAGLVQEANSWAGAPRHLPIGFARATAPVLAIFRPDLARRLTIGIAMNEPEPADDREAEVPTWVVTHPITPKTLAVAR